MKDSGSILKIGLIQMFCEKGDVVQNLKATEQYILEAEKRGIDILGFPEASLTGFNDPAKYSQAVVRLDGPEIDSVLRLSLGRDITLLPGLIELNPAGKPFVTQAVIRNGQLIGRYRKQVIKDGESVWFESGQALPVFTHNNIRFGISICADIGEESLFATYAGQGAQIVFELAAPGLYGSREQRNWQTGYQWWEGECLKLLGSYARKYKLWIAVATQAGRTIDEDFPGGGYVFAPDGKRVFTTLDWFPKSVYLDLDLTRKNVIVIP